MANVNAAVLLDNLADFREQGERAAVEKLGIGPDEFRIMVGIFSDSPVREEPILDRTKTRQVCEVAVGFRKYKFIKTSVIKELKKGHALHNRAIHEIRGATWRVLFTVAVNSHPVDDFAQIRANIRMGGWVQCFNIVCVGDVEALQHEIVLMKMFQ